jgi:outer membrane lipoprotein SlyB
VTPPSESLKENARTFRWVVLVSRFVSFGLSAIALAAFAGCTPDYSPNTYAGNAVQQANKVEPAVVIGFRQVEISANGTVGVVSGGAAGGILGSQAGAVGVNAALGAVGGTVIGGLVGTGIEHMTGDTAGWEYIVRKPNGDLLSVTQTEPTPLPIGQKVLVITGNQARIVPDYSAMLEPPATAGRKGKTAEDQMAAGKSGAKPAPEAAPASPAASTQISATPAGDAATAAAGPVVPAAAMAPASSPAAASMPSSEAARAASPSAAATGGDKNTP